MAKKTSTMKACPTEKDQWSASEKDVAQAYRSVVLAKLKELPLDQCNAVVEKCYYVIDVDARNEKKMPVYWFAKAKTRKEAESIAKRRKVERGHVALAVTEDTYYDLANQPSFSIHGDTRVKKPVGKSPVEIPKELGYIQREGTGFEKLEQSRKRMLSFEEKITPVRTLPPIPSTIHPPPRTKECPTEKGQAIEWQRQREIKRIQRIEREIAAEKRKRAEIEKSIGKEKLPELCNRKSEKCFYVIALSPQAEKAEVLAECDTKDNALFIMEKKTREYQRSKKKARWNITVMTREEAIRVMMSRTALVEKVLPNEEKGCYTGE